MKPVRFTAALAIKLEPNTRRAVESLAAKNQMSLGEAARVLLNAGIVAKGLEC
jgi:hypothetical protein